MAERPIVLSAAIVINRAPWWKDLYAADASCSREAAMKHLMVARWRPYSDRAKAKQ